LFGSGFMGRGILNQGKYHEGARCAAVCNRTIATARRGLDEAGIVNVQVVSNSTELDRVIASGGTAVTDNPDALTGSKSIEAIIDATGHVEYGARIVSAAIDGRKHVILLNAELDGTIGPLLKSMADSAGVVYTGCDGDQPAVELNLYRFVKALGLEPLVCGNIKGLHDPYRNPTTQESFARKWGQSPTMVTSFADGTKISFEQAITANATGMTVTKRGMLGRQHAGHVDELVNAYDVEELRAVGGVVDYVVGAQPSPGVYVLAAARDATQAHFLNLGKLGEGPLYSFYIPYHLTVLEAPLSVVRAVEFGDAAIAPAGRPMVEVVTVAKRDLRAGETIDGLGGYMTYGVCEKYHVSGREGLLPMGLAEGCVLLREMAQDEVLRVEDVRFPPRTLVQTLRAEQDAMFPA
jgi:predicted homoserine dehydrogenase-like protein